MLTPLKHASLMKPLIYVISIFIIATNMIVTVQRYILLCKVTIG